MTPKVIYGLRCVACDKAKSSITSALCPKCEVAILNLLPQEFFEFKLSAELAPLVSIVGTIETIELADAA